MIRPGGHRGWLVLLSPRVIRHRWVFAWCVLTCVACAHLTSAYAAERSVTILTSSLQDERFGPTNEAVDFWNEVLAGLGVATRLGKPVVQSETPRVVESYARLIAQRAGRLPVPARLEPEVPEALGAIEGDIIILLSEQDIMSFAWALPRLDPKRYLVVIRKVRGLDRNDPMVSRHVVAHELGHALGLYHNDAPHTLMCGPCQPLTAESEANGFLPLTNDERARLVELH